VKKPHQTDVHSICKTTEHYQIGRKGHDENPKQTLQSTSQEDSMLWQEERDVETSVVESEKATMERKFRDNSADDHETKYLRTSGERYCVNLWRQTTFLHQTGNIWQSICKQYGKS